MKRLLLALALLLSTAVSFSQYNLQLTGAEADSAINWAFRILKGYPVYNAMAYGLSAGGSAAVNTAAIQAAIDVGGVAFIPKGTYSINATLRISSGKSLRGAGWDQTILKMAAADTAIVMTLNRPSLSDLSIISDTGYDSVYVGVATVGQYPATSCYEPTISNVKCYYPQVGFSIGGSTYFGTFTHLSVYKFGRYGLRFEQGANTNSALGTGDISGYSQAVGGVGVVSLGSQNTVQGGTVGSCRVAIAVDGTCNNFEGIWSEVIDTAAINYNGTNYFNILTAAGMYSYGGELVGKRDGWSYYSSTPPTVVNSDSLKILYNFSDNPAGTVIQDFSGNGSNGTLYSGGNPGAVTWTSGLHGKAPRLSSTASQFVHLSNMRSKLDLGKSWTAVIAWRPNSIPDGAILFSMAGAGGRYFRIITAGDGNYYQIASYNGSTLTTQAYTSGVHYADKWNWCAAYFDSATSTGYIVDPVYGEYPLTVPFPTGMGADVDGYLNYVSTGGRVFTVDYGFFGLWQRKLSLPEVNTLINLRTPYMGVPGQQPVISKIIDKGGQVFNVKSYGAAGNGSSDDSTAIYNAIKAANDAGGGVVYFPPGTYKTGAIKPTYVLKNVTLRGAGMGATILDFSSSTAARAMEFNGTVGSNLTLASNAARNDTLIVLNNASTVTAGDMILIHSSDKFKVSTYERGELAIVKGKATNTLTVWSNLFDSYTTTASAYIFVINPVKDVTVEGLTIKRTTQNLNGVIGLTFAWAQNIKVKNVCVQYGTTFGIEFTDVLNGEIVGCRVEETYYAGTGYSDAICIQDACQEIRVSNCYFKRFRNAISTSGATSGITRMVTCTNNNADQMLVPGVTIGGYNTHEAVQYVTYAGNTIHGTVTGGAPFSIHGYDNVVTGNTIYSLGTGISSWGYPDYDENLVFSNNTIQLSGSSGQGIIVRGSGAVISGNTISNVSTSTDGLAYTGAGILVQPTSADVASLNVAITGNKISGFTYGIQLKSLQGGIVSNNSLFNVGTRVIRLDSNGTAHNKNIIISNNQYSDNASLALSGIADFAAGRGSNIQISNNNFKFTYASAEYADAPNAIWTSPLQEVNKVVRPNPPKYVGDPVAKLRIAVQDSGGQVFNVKAFGAICDGTTEDSTAVKATIAAASAAGGGIVLFPPDTTKISCQLTIPSKVTLKGAGKGNTVLNFSGYAGERVVYLRGDTSTATAALVLTGNVGQNDTSLTVSDASSISAGDWVLLRSTAAFKHTTTTTRGEIMQVKAKTSNTLRFNRRFYDSYTTAASARIQKITPVTDVTIRDLTLLRQDQETADRIGIETYFTTGLVIENVGVNHATYAAIRLFGGYDTKISGCTVENSMKPGSSSAYYGVSSFAMEQLRIVDNYFFRMRHGVTISGIFAPSRNVIVMGNNVEGGNILKADYANAYDTHPGSEFITFQGNTGNSTYHYAMRLGGYSTSAIGNILYGSGGIYSDVTDTVHHVIEGNIITLTESTGDDLEGIYVAGSGTKILGNYINCRNSVAGKYTVGIRVHDPNGASNVVSDVDILSNQITGLHYIGILIEGGKDITVASNKIKDAESIGIDLELNGSAVCNYVTLRDNTISESTSFTGTAIKSATTNTNIAILGNNTNIVGTKYNTGNTTIAPTVVYGFQDKGGQVYSAVAYGLSTSGTGAANLIALQAAVTAAGKGVVYIPAGNYNITLAGTTRCNLVNGSHIVGAGKDDTKLNISVDTSGAVNNIMFYVTPGDTALIENFTIQNLGARGTAYTVGIGTYTTTLGLKVTARNIRFKNIVSGMHFNGSGGRREIEADGCDFDSLGYRSYTDAINCGGADPDSITGYLHVNNCSFNYINGGGDPMVSGCYCPFGMSMRVTNSRFNNISGEAVQSFHYAIGTAEYFIVDNCWFKDCREGVYTTADSNIVAKITNCTFDSANVGVASDGRALIRGNTFKRGTGVANNFSTASHVMVYDNTFINMRYGINAGSTYGAYNGYEIVGNHFIQNNGLAADVGIYISSNNVPKVTIKNNTFEGTWTTYGPIRLRNNLAFVEGNRFFGAGGKGPIYIDQTGVGRFHINNNYSEATASGSSSYAGYPLLYLAGADADYYMYGSNNTATIDSTKFFEFWLAGEAAFTTSAVIDTVTIYGAKSTDRYEVTPIAGAYNTQPVADDLLNCFAIPNGLVVNRAAGTTSGLKYAWKRIKW